MIKGWKTFLVALAIAVVSALEAFDFTEFLTADNAAYVTGGISVVMFILRTVTSSPVFKSE